MDGTREEDSRKSEVRLWLVAFAGLASVGCFATEAMTVKLFLQAREVTEWPTAHGLVLRSQLVSQFEGVTIHKANVEYEFSVDGRSFRSHSVRTRGTESKRRFDIQSVVDRYPVDAEVTVYYSPSDPGISYLEAGPDWIDYLIIITPVFFGVTFGWAFHDTCTQYVAQRRSAKPASS